MTMDANELRALADALDSPASGMTMAAAAIYLRAYADAKPVAMLASHRRLIEQAIQSAEHPSGMSTHDGKARIDASILRRMLAIIDSLPAAPKDENNVWKQIIPDDAPQAEPKLEPLSDDEISKLAWKQNLWTDGMIEFSFVALAREVERAHGISGGGHD